MLLKSDKEGFNIFYNDMVKQFPKEELKTEDVFIELINSGNYDVLSAFDRRAYVFIAKDDENSVLWLDYLAVVKQFHSKGYGKQIIQSLSEYYPEYFGCYLEVEKPDENIPDTIRRIKFYENLGAVKLNIRYFYPNKNGDLPMDLYFLPFRNFIAENTLKTIQNIFFLLHSDITHIKSVLNKITCI